MSGQGKNQKLEFLRIFTVAFLLFLAPMGGSNPEGHLLTLTKPKITHYPCMCKYEETDNFGFFP